MICTEANLFPYGRLSVDSNQAIITLILFTVWDWLSSLTDKWLFGFSTLNLKPLQPQIISMCFSHFVPGWMFYILRWERFSIEYLKTKTETKVMTLANHKGHRQAVQWIFQISKEIHVADLKHNKTFVSSPDWFWFHFWLDDNGERVSTTSQVCITVSNSPNRPRVEMRLYIHGKSALLLNWFCIAMLIKFLPFTVLGHRIPREIKHCVSVCK